LGKLIDGIAVASRVKSNVKKAVDELKSMGVQPCLATVLVGDNPASATYVKNKQKAAAEIGISTRDYSPPETFTHMELLELVQSLNTDSEVHGILVQLPLPSQINEFEVISVLSPFKDVDGLTPLNAGMLLYDRAILKPCTPSGIMELLDFYGIDISGMDAVVVNRSNLVGKPLAFLLLQRNATVTLCHSKTKNLPARLADADLIVTAVGDRAQFTLTAAMVKKDAVVIDVGTTMYKGKLSGDADLESVREKAAWITPVPGGVGPMTIAMLLKNVVTAASGRREMYT